MWFNISRPNTAYMQKYSWLSKIHPLFQNKPQQSALGSVYAEQNSLTGFQKRKALAGEDKIQDDIMNLHEAYQFLMKKYK